MADRSLAEANNLFSFKYLTELVNKETSNAKMRLSSIKNAGSSVSIASMFDMQLQMNRLSQFSEMSTAVALGAHNAVVSAARNIK